MRSFVFCPLIYFAEWDQLQFHSYCPDRPQSLSFLASEVDLDVPHAPHFHHYLSGCEEGFQILVAVKSRMDMGIMFIVSCSQEKNC